MRVKTALALVLAFALTGGALAADLGAKPGDVLAKVEDVIITQGELDEIIASANPSQQEYFRTAAGKRALLKDMTSSTLFYIWGRDNKIMETEKYRHTIEEIKKRIAGTMVIEQVISDVKVPDEDVQAYYDGHKAAFMVPESVRASHILIGVAEDADSKAWDKARKDLKDLRKDIAAGRITFEDAAKEKSDDTSKANGGDLGYFTRGQMVPEFEKAAFETKVGEVSSPVKTQFGYHLVKVTDKKEAFTRTLDEVKEDLREQLLQQKRRDTLQEFLDKLNKKYKVEILLPEIECPTSS